MIFKICLYIHILAGILGLVIGPVAMYAKKSKGLHTRSGKIYFYLMAAVCVSATVLSIMHWSTSWWFLIVAVFSFSFALRGYLATFNKYEGWLKKHISGMLGSYIAMSTALLVVNSSNLPTHIPGVVYWVLPTIIGTPFIIRVTRKYIK